jgi:hypothetical protein
MQITVKNVISVEGKTLNPMWSMPMYLIIADNDNLYIDNTMYHRYAKWEPTEWKELIGKRVEIDVVHDSNYAWAKYKETYTN